jgi:hypothetical protein
MKSFYPIVVFIFSSFVLYSQNVGIGTTGPASKLSVNGNLAIGSNYLSTPAPANGALIEGKVGLGTTSPLGTLHIRSTNSDTTLILDRTTSGYAAKIKGTTDMQGAIINTSNSFGGSVAVNDGLTVGDVQIGTVCYTDTPATCSFLFWYNAFWDDYGTSNFVALWNLVPGFQPPQGQINEVFNPSCNRGDCRSITKFKHTSRFFEYSGGGSFGIFANIEVNNTLVSSIQVTSAVGSDVGNSDTIRTFIDSTNVFNGQDPNIPWVLKMYGTDPRDDVDMCTDMLAEIRYNYGGSIASGAFALYGEVRASSALYANSFSRYGDVAEFMEVRKHLEQKPEPGDLVSVDPDNPQSFILSSKVGDPLLIGAISEKPSVFINSPDAGMPIALTGRVKVKVNTHGGSIKPGDMITSSSKPGEGMKLNGDGTFIGYALESFDGERTETGKVWILLAPRTNQITDNSYKVVKGQDYKLGGVEVRGTKRVLNNEKEVFVAWDKVLDGKINNDIDFDDLVVDLNAFGGHANLSVKEVNKDGFLVSISKKSSAFKGFYYVVNIVAPSLYTEEADEPASAATVNSSSNVVTEPIVSEDANSIYQEWLRKTDVLIKKSGKDFSTLKNLKPEEISKEKLAIAESWKKADPKAFNERLSLGLKLDEIVRSNPGIRLTN